MDLYAILGGLIAGALALIWAFIKGGKSAKTKAKLDTAKATDKAHERLNNAKAGSDDDDLNIGSLRDFVDRYGKR
jgi:hypothetical protein